VVNKRILIAPLAALTLTATGAVSAQATLIGDSGQSNTQSFGTDQSSNEAASTSGISVTGGGTEKASNASDSLGAAGEVIASGTGAIVGGPRQSTAQNDATTQNIHETGSSNSMNGSTSVLGSLEAVAVTAGGVIVGSPAQANAQGASTKQNVDPGRNSALNTASTIVTNVEIVLGTATAPIVGSPTQSNVQNAATSQTIAQTRSGFPSSFLVAYSQTASNHAATGLSNGMLIGGLNPIVGSPGQSSAQSGAIGQNVTQAAPTNNLTVGPVTQVGSNADTADADNAAAIL
jgi:hypothetical protein